LAVHPVNGTVDILAEPAPYRPRPTLPQRRRLLKEHATRRGDTTRGGSSRQPIMTAYRQQAIACATSLEAGPMRPRDLKAVAPDAGPILRRNVYGWFERVQPGLYQLSDAGAVALRRWGRDGTRMRAGSGWQRTATDLTEREAPIPIQLLSVWRRVLPLRQGHLNAGRLREGPKQTESRAGSAYDRQGGQHAIRAHV